MQNYRQVQRLENMGYRGIYAFEPFLPGWLLSERK